MSDKEIENILVSLSEFTCDDLDISFDCLIDEISHYIKRLKEKIDVFEKKIMSGQLAELPCKIGDTVYVVYSPFYGEYEIKEAQALGFEIGATGIRIITNFSCYETYRIGNFTGKKQAQAKLKELKGED